MQNIETFLKSYFSPSDKIILACSTWPDSMYLLYQILETSYKDNLVVCYFNHKLRPEADEEEKFIEELGKKLWFQVEIWIANIKAIHEKIPSKSIEEIAREKRYAFFDAILHIYKSKYILTAHHLDDKIETFMFNLLRWSKITGLINMTEKSWSILRPLLNITKNEILDYLDKNNLKYFLDKSNLDTEITRNFLRLEIIPKLWKVNLNFKENINNFMWYLESAKEHIDNEVKKFLETFSNENEELKYFWINSFNSLSQFLQNEVIRYIYFIRNWNSTIWLSENNIAEIIRFINWKWNKTIKEIKKLSMKKSWDKIYF